MLTPNEIPINGNSYNAGWIFFDNPNFGAKGFFYDGSNGTWYSYAVASSAVSPNRRE